MLFDDYSSHEKQIQRERTITPGKKYHKVIDLPGAYCRSVKYLMSQNHIGAWTHLTTVERDIALSKRISTNLKRVKCDSRIDSHVGQLIDLDTTGQVFDLVNADTCSILSIELLQWISNLDFAKDGELNVWVCAFRNSGSWKSDLIKSYSMGEGSKLMNDFQMNQIVGHNTDITAAASLCAIRTALNRYQCVTHTPIKYTQNCMSMYIYRFTSIRKAKCVRPSLDNLIVKSDYLEKEWESNKPSDIPDGSFTDKIIHCVKSNRKMQMVFISKQMRVIINDNEKGGKDIKWIKAGWKACVSRRKCDPQTLRAAHNLIDAA